MVASLEYVVPRYSYIWSWFTLWLVLIKDKVLKYLMYIPIVLK